MSVRQTSRSVVWWCYRPPAGLWVPSTTSTTDREDLCAQSCLIGWIFSGGKGGDSSKHFKPFENIAEKIRCRFFDDAYNSLSNKKTSDASSTLRTIHGVLPRARSKRRRVSRVCAVAAPVRLCCVCFVSEFRIFFIILPLPTLSVVSCCYYVHC